MGNRKTVSINNDLDDFIEEHMELLEDIFGNEWAARCFEKGVRQTVEENEGVEAKLEKIRKQEKELKNRKRRLQNVKDRQDAKKEKRRRKNRLEELKERIDEVEEYGKLSDNELKKEAEKKALARLNQRTRWQDKLPNSYDAFDPEQLTEAQKRRFEAWREEEIEELKNTRSLEELREEKEELEDKLGRMDVEI
ncbi:hypothetical protein [Candidatus Nanohalococcus occultus]|uniref:hypothetical protein n=1 Tax=Candidatus Nanohalococcus occultus TaxID=2978047 RepID=UPI0039DFEB05